MTVAWASCRRKRRLFSRIRITGFSCNFTYMT
jgi:hypothetical protein